MGILNTLLSEQSTQDSVFSPRESFASFLMATATADNHCSPNELDHYCTIINRMKLFHGMTRGEFKAMLQKIVSLLADQGRSHVIEKATEGLPKELRETAFTVAADAAFADGSIVDCVGANWVHPPAASAGSEWDDGPEHIVKLLPLTVGKKI